MGNMWMESTGQSSSGSTRYFTATFVNGYGYTPLNQHGAYQFTLLLNVKGVLTQTVIYNVVVP